MPMKVLAKAIVQLIQSLEFAGGEMAIMLDGGVFDLPILTVLRIFCRIVAICWHAKLRELTHFGCRK